MKCFADVLIAALLAAHPAVTRPAPVNARSEHNMITLHNGLLTAQYDVEKGTFAARRGDRVFITEGRLDEKGSAGGTAKAMEVRDPLGVGRAIEVAWPDGRLRRLALYEDLPFVCASGSVRNTTDKAITVANVTPLVARIDAGTEVAKLRGFGPEGPYKIAGPKRQFCFAAAAEPKGRAGIVAGWITHHRGSGVITMGAEEGRLMLEGQSQYGRLLVPAGAKADGEVLAVGLFDDCLAGLEAYAGACAKAHRIKLPAQVPSGYCTWYHAGASNEKRLAELAAFAGKHLRPFGFDFVQIDDGWQIRGRDFTTFNPKGRYAGGMKQTAARIRAAGLTAGIWFIPFGWDPKCPALADHGDWFVHRPDGRIYAVSWAGSCLDMTHPQARAFLRKVISRITRDWGYKYIKIDGLWSGMAVALLYPSPAYRPDGIGQAVLHDPKKTQVEAYRDGLRLVREAAGKDVFILGCNIAQNARTLGGSIGLVDGMRIGHDISANWGSIRGCAVPTSHFYFFHRSVWFNDPDCLMLRRPLTLDQARAWGSLIALSGQMNVVSEQLPNLPAAKLDVVKRTMPNHNGLGRPIDLFANRLPRVWHYRATRGGRPVDLVGLFNWSDGTPAQVGVKLEQLALPAGEKDRYVGFDYWENTLVPPFAGQVRATLRPSSCRVISIVPYEERPQLVGTSRHITQGVLDVKSVRWDAGKQALRGTSVVVAGDPYELRLTAPPVGRETWTARSATASRPGSRDALPLKLSQRGPMVRVRIDSPTGGEVEWQVRFAKAPRPPAGKPGVTKLQAEVLSPTTVELRWEGREACSYRVRRDDGPAVVTAKPEHVDEDLQPDTAYVYRVSALDWSGRPAPPAEVRVRTPALPPRPPKPDVHLSDLAPLKATSEWGGPPKKDRSILGKPLRIGGRTYAKGMGVHANSELAYALKREFKRFVALVGLDDEKSHDPRASVVFEVHVDGRRLGRWAVKKANVVRSFDVAIPPGSKQIRLVVTDAGDGIACDHADWVDAGFLRK